MKDDLPDEWFPRHSITWETGWFSCLDRELKGEFLGDRAQGLIIGVDDFFG